VTVLPMMLVMTTTSTAAVEILTTKIETMRMLTARASFTASDWAMLRSSGITGGLLVAMLGCTIVILAASAWTIARILPSSENMN
jgi:hypothetical protein